jgi:hypothetical protein
VLHRLRRHVTKVVLGGAREGGTNPWRDIGILRRG